jgi:Fe-S oxidoreductase
MRAFAEDRLEAPEAIQPHIDRCLGCRACETACPSGVEYGRILEEQRAELEERWPDKSFKSRIRRALLRHVVAHQGRLRVAFYLARLAELTGVRALMRGIGLLSRDADALLPRLPPARERRSIAGIHRPEGEPRKRVHLFTGCLMEQVFGRINRLTVELLTANGFEVVVPREQGCCAALHLHSGMARDAAQLAERNLHAFADAEVIINNSAGCGASLREYGAILQTEQAKALSEACRDICEFLAEEGLSATPRPFPKRVTYDAPCHLEHGQAVVDAPLSLLRQVPEIELLVNPSSSRCCGSAGIYNLLQPELANRIGQEKSESLMTVGAEYVATGNPGCMLQIAKQLNAAGSTTRVLHPVEILLP